MTVLAFFSCKQRGNTVSESDFTGSQSCKECHERFYQLWSPSHHGKAMEPINAEYILSKQLPASPDFELEGKHYRVEFGDSTMTMIESNGDSAKTFKILWALGGKNVSYYLTDLGDGKLQTIPLAFDHNKKIWYNNPESAVRHFPDSHAPADQALPWKDRMYTFNTSCYSCHVSQLETNFDLASDSYHSTWKEPGINCETCHGPSAEHVRVMEKAAKKDKIPADIKIIKTSIFTQDQHNASCAPCHAQMRPITPAYMPGDRFFDNFNLVTFEDADFYPDGRDLGETYTFTSWNQNQCMIKGELHCVTCHTSSGRNRYKDNPNEACLQCHNNRSENLTAHTMHKADSQGSVCVNCHMPQTMFGRMVQSDHSFRPPMPEATIRYGSPNACNLCHTDKTPQWANAIVKARPNGNYQEKTLHWADLILQARQEDWRNLDDMLAIINNEEYDAVVQNTFVRLIENCANEKKWPVFMKAAVENPSPLVRASAAAGLLDNISEEAKNTLIKACKDEYRVVRVSAALPLAAFPAESFSAADTAAVKNATQEYITSIVSRPDDWSSHYNMGLYYQNRGEMTEALTSYETAAKLYPESLLPLINSSVLYSYVGNSDKAEANLRKALQYDPGNEAANLNLGLLMAEHGRMDEAESALKAALAANPNGQAVAAKNLSVIVAQRGDIQNAVKYAGIAHNIRPEDVDIAYTLAFYQMQNGQKKEAISNLKAIIAENPNNLNAIQLLSESYVQDGKRAEAVQLYRNFLKIQGLTDQEKAVAQQWLQVLSAAS
jgi:tetratricopeptide (TPR) repeat protein